MTEDALQFESRKLDHLRITLDPKVQVLEARYFDRVQLIPEALPEIDLSEVSICQHAFGKRWGAPIFVSSMTAGHKSSHDINLHLAKVAAQHQWMMGVGSQRRELKDPEARQEWRQLRKQVPEAMMFANLGLSQLIHSDMDEVLRLADDLEACGFFIHTNPLQEALQTEGTPHFRGGLQAIEQLVKKLDQRFGIPLVVKEVGSGISEKTLLRLNSVGVYAVDLAGMGGTHWGRVETARAVGLAKSIGQTFSNWGLSTVECMLSARELQVQDRIRYQVWASGGVRSGLDVAKLIAMGAQMVGVAQPLLQACLDDLDSGGESLHQRMQQMESELRISLFCTGSENLQSFRSKGVWKYA